MNRFRSRRIRAFWLSFLLSFAVYWITLAPTVTSEDSGELITAAYTLGVAHPPGYPLWCLLGKSFTFLPFGSVAWRVNLLSATLGSVSVGILALLVLRWTHSLSIAVGAALAFAFSRDFWNQSVVAEVYTLNVLFFLGVIWLLFRFEDTFKTRWLYGTAFVLGLSLTNHSTMGPLLPVFLGWVFLRHWDLFRQPILLLNMALSFLLGFSIVLYLPLRSAVDPVMDWGNPETLAAVKDHLLRRQYTQSETPTPRTFAHQAILAWSFCKSFASQFGVPFAFLTLVGFAVQRRRHLATWLLFTILFVMTSYGFIWLLNYPADRENLHLTRVMFLPANAIGALWLGIGASACARWLRKRFVRRRFRTQARTAIAVAAVLVASTPLVLHFRANDHSDEYLADEWGRNILSSLKPEAIIFPAADHSTFPLIYLQACEGLRPDVLIGDRYGYVEDRIFREVFSRESPPPVAPPLGKSSSEKVLYLIKHSLRPVYLTAKKQEEGLGGYELQTSGLVFEVVDGGQTPDGEQLTETWDALSFRPASLERPSGAFGVDLILSDYYYARARTAIALDDKETAAAAILRAAEYSWGLKEALNNLGGTLAEAEMPEHATELLEEALRLDPEYALAVANLAMAYYSLERYDDGLSLFNEAVALRPNNLIFLLSRARAYRAVGYRHNARADYLSYLLKRPQDAEVQDEFESFVTSKFGEDQLETDREFIAAATKESPGDQEKSPKMPAVPQPSIPNAGVPTAPFGSAPRPGVPTMPSGLPGRGSAPLGPTPSLGLPQ